MGACLCWSPGWIAAGGLTAALIGTVVVLYRVVKLSETERHGSVETMELGQARQAQAREARWGLRLLVLGGLGQIYAGTCAALGRFP